MGTSNGNRTLEDVLAGRSTQKLVRDDISFAPPLDPWAAILQAAKLMHDRRSEPTYAYYTCTTGAQCGQDLASR